MTSLRTSGPGYPRFSGASTVLTTRPSQCAITRLDVGSLPMNHTSFADVPEAAVGLQLSKEGAGTRTHLDPFHRHISEWI